MTIPLSPDDKDLLLSRIVDAEATADDWSTFRALAASDHAVWSELADLQRLSTTLAAALQQATRRADLIDLPLPTTHSASPSPDSADLRARTLFRARADAVTRWAGWAAAAAIVALWVGNLSGLLGPITLPSGTNHASLLPAAASTPDEALARYYELGKSDGRVLREIPDRVVLTAFPTDDGRVEVTYLRQIVERSLIDRVYTQSLDELGRPVHVPTQLVPAQLIPARATPSNAF
jgi:hypothetical protein